MTKSKLFERCPRTRRITGLNRAAWPKWSLLFAGLLATVWYLVRVVPKPTRATYPCLEVTAPVRWAFLAYAASVGLSAVALQHARRYFRHAKVAAGVLCVALFAGGTILSVASDAGPAAAAFIGCETGDLANQPIGVARGIFPGRVAWVHDPAVASYDGNGNWWDDAYNDQAAADAMVSNAVRTISGESSPAAAWGAIFQWFNGFHGRGAAGYQAGERIAIKINQNNQQGHNSNNDINGNPTMILALLKSLINDAGVPQDMITVYDASRGIGDNIYNKCTGEFPNVVFVDHFGGDGRVQSQYADNAIQYSANNGNLDTGLATAAVDATYLINLAILKGHGGQGVTFGAKNMYGMTSISNDYTQNAHDNFNPNGGCSPRYMTFTDWMAHEDMGEKTVLWLMNAVYPTFALGGTPSDRWDAAPFNGHWASSVFASLDGVANESVSIDFFRDVWSNAPDMEYADQYLHEAALADNPPSGTFYDPEGDGTRAPSLGAHEHWNNSTDRQYSRNLGTGDGIELVYVGPSGPTVPLCGDGNCDPGEECPACEADCGPCGAAGAGSGGGSGTSGTGGSAVGGTAGTGATGSGGTGGSAAVGGTAGTGATGATGSGATSGTAGAVPVGASSSDEESSCGCRVAGTRGGSSGGLLLGLLLVGVLARRRRDRDPSH